MSSSAYSATLQPKNEPSTLFRSETMSLIQLYIPSELAHPAVSELGELGMIQFKDLNADANNFQRTFVSEIRRLDEMERRVRFLMAQLEKAGIKVRNSGNITPTSTRPRTLQEIDELDAQLVDLEKKFNQMNNSMETLNKRFLELTELRHVLRETAYFFERSDNEGFLVLNSYNRNC
jgi:V-type H+-transporting ATPase subunit a